MTQFCFLPFWKFSSVASKVLHLLRLLLDPLANTASPSLPSHASFPAGPCAESTVACSEEPRKACVHVREARCT